MTAPTIAEQIDKYGLESMKPHILASLKRLAAIESQPVPVEPKPFGYLCEWDSLNQAFYYGEPGSASVDDWNKFPKVHHNLPLYSKDTIDSLQSALQVAQEELEKLKAEHAALRHYAIALQKATEPFCAIKADDNDTLNGYAPETIIRIEASVFEIRGLRMCAGYGQPVSGTAIDQAMKETK